MLEDAIKLTENNFLPLRQVVFNSLRYAILHGDLKPGERLMEVKLADILGVSRTPVREALKLLEEEGLVKLIPRRGAIVDKIDEKTMTDVLVVRRALEALAVKLACETITKGDIQKLKEVTDNLELAVDRNDIEKIADLDVKFHDIIFQSTQNKKLLQMLNDLREQMYRYRFEYVKNESEHIRILKEHRAIIKSLEEHDKTQATAVVKKHIDNQGETVKKLLNKEI